jgi:cell division protein FtsQ
MEIRTKRAEREEQEPAREQARYLRRKTVQKVRRTHWAGGLLLRGLAVLARVAAVVFAVVVAAVVFYDAISSGGFSLKRVTIIGGEHADAAGLESIVRRDFPANVLKIDLHQVGDRLEREAWVEQADVRRVLPSDLVIRIRERVATVILELNGELMLADRTGILLDRFDPKYGKLDLPVFKGMTGDDPAGYRAHQRENSARVVLGQRMLEELESGSPAFVSNISEVDLSDPADVKLLLVDDTAEILLGDRDFLRRFRTLMANLAQYRELQAQYQEIASVDLRYEGQIIYRPRATPGDQVVEAPESRQ